MAAEKVFLAFPCYNPQPREWLALEGFLADLRSKCPHPFECVVVDDGSPRWTEPPGALLAACRVHRLRRNRGKGGAIREAVRLMPSDATIFSFLDFDLPYSADDLIGVCAAVRAGADACIGDRAVPSISAPSVAVSDRLSRHVSHKLFRLFLRMIITGGIFDTQCGLKAFHAPAVRRIAALGRLDGFLFDVEWLYIALRHRLAVRCWPVRVREEHASTPLRSIGIGKSFRQLVALLRGILARAYDDLELLRVADARRAWIRVSFRGQ